jgi:hypothetical protein
MNSPSRLSSSTGGAAILPAASSAAGTPAGRLSTQMCPRRSDATESAPPKTQLLGSAFGHAASRVNDGTGGDFDTCFFGDLAASA